jgi:hypothetical protein
MILPSSANLKTCIEVSDVVTGMETAALYQVLAQKKLFILWSLSQKWEQIGLDLKENIPIAYESKQYKELIYKALSDPLYFKRKFSTDLIIPSFMLKYPDLLKQNM